MVDLEPMRLLKAFALEESTLGVDLGEDGMIRRRIEPSYSPGGHYYERSDLLRMGYVKWGILAASSHGPWQIMWATAIRFGWPEDRAASELGNPEENCEIATKIFDKELRDIYSFAHATSNPRYKTSAPLELLADAYNSGNARDTIIPTKYMLEVCAHYDRMTESGEYP